MAAGRIPAAAEEVMLLVAGMSGKTVFGPMAGEGSPSPLRYGDLAGDVDSI
jgi:hypothetical protein